MWKEWLYQYNPFNSLKAIAWREKLEKLAKGELTTPVTVFVDPTNLCDVNCSWCVDEEFRKRAATTMSSKALLALPNFLKEWGVEGVEVTGGGEPLLHPQIVAFLEGLKESGLKVGLQTSGVKLSEVEIRKAVLKCCDWVGISLDSVTPHTYLKIKKTLVGNFHKVVENVALLVKEREKARPHITLKFLIHHLNYGEMYQFADLAKSLGVDAVHFRPAYLNAYNFSPGVRKTSEWHLREARKALEDENFHIYGIVHKFEKEWKRAIRFKKCRATPLVGVFAANGVFYICPDNRGVSEFSLGRFYPFENLQKAWGGAKHREILKHISPKACPKCSLCVVNEILEQAFQEDNMFLEFL